MPQVTVYLDKRTEQKARSAAKRAGKSLSGWLRAVIELAPEGEWPSDFERLFGSISDERFVVPERPKPEQGVLVTGNIREFRKVPGLKLENWLAA
jgi:hypothetical protein